MYFYRKVLLGLIGLVVIVVIVIAAWQFAILNQQATTNAAASLPTIVSLPTQNEPIKLANIKVGEESKLVLPNGIAVSKFPKFVIDGVARPTKKDFGVHELTGQNSMGQQIKLILEVSLSKIDNSKLKSEIEKAIGTGKQNYAVIVKDLNRKVGYRLNPGETMWPGSVGKLPVVILALRDLDSGKRKGSDTYPVQSIYKHSTADAIGALPNGTKVTLDKLIYETIHTSNNSAMYHLRAAIGGVLKVSDRTKKELRAIEFHDLPTHAAEPQQVAHVLADVYEAKTLTVASRDRLFKLMNEASPSLRDGIPLAVEDKSGTKAYTKVGFLYGKGKTAYNDVGIVSGKYTDYLIVYMSKNIPLASSKIKARAIAEIAQKYFDRP